ncbi:MAG: dockerin type I repeat-containing protein [Oscillospiraceae bacterium]|nr:dockerin type I repeat-containing protein [Oscillospiraceae bacterium]
MKKITAFLLCLSIVSGMCAPAYALVPRNTNWEQIEAELKKLAEEQDTYTHDKNTPAAGDIDEDGDTDITDLSSLALYLLGDMNFSDAQKKIADVDGDGDVTLADLAKYRQFLSKKIPYLVEPENSSDPGDKPTAPSVEPVTPMYPQPTGRPDINAVKQMIKTGDVSGYDEERRQKYKDVYDRFTEDGYIIQPLSSADEDGIKYAEDREVSLMINGTYEDMGVLYNMEYKGVHYSVSVHFTEPQYKDSFTTMAEYHELRMGSMERYEEADNKTIIAHLPLRDIDNGTQIVSYSLIDYNDYDHYCRVSTTASDEDYAEFMEMLQLKKNYLNAPLLVIRDENAESDKINSLICEDGRTYSVGIIMFKPRPDDTLLKDDWFSYIIDYSENESYIEDKYFLTQLSKISKYAAEKKLQPVKDTGIKSLNESDLSLNIIYTDETGKSVTPVLLSKADGKYFMADYNETQILADSGIVTLIRYLTGYGLIDQEFLKAVDSIEIPEEDNVEPVYEIKNEFMDTPLLLIQEKDAYGSWFNNVFTGDGTRYREGAVPDSGRNFKDDINYVIENGEKGTYIRPNEGELLQKIYDIAQNGQKYSESKSVDSGVKNLSGKEFSVVVICTDESGEMKPLNILDATSASENGTYIMRKDNDLFALALELVRDGYILGRDGSTLGKELAIEFDNDRSPALNAAELKEKYPEYFELTHSKGIEVYVWQIAENIYRCGLMSGTNRNKTEEEILALQSSPLTIAEAKIILNELGVKNSDVFTYAITQPDTLYSYEVNENYRKTVENLFK